MFDPLGYYDLLGVQEPLTDMMMLKEQYHYKAKYWHPDHNSDPEAMSNFQKLAVAYEILKDDKKRMVYRVLSTIYSAENFPDMNSLKIYKANNGEETPFLRITKLYKVSGLKCTQQSLIGTYEETVGFVKNITRHNWLFGWWAPKTNITALKNNYKSFNQNDADNYKLLAHNTAAYLSYDNPEKACLSAQQSLSYANSDQRQVMINFLRLYRSADMSLKSWNYEYLQNVQLYFPRRLLVYGAVLFLFLLGMGFLQYKGGWQQVREEAIAYYQKVRFNSGNETVNDMVIGKIFNVPVDTSDDTMLYYVTSSQKVMYGPDEKFDIMTEAQKGQTVRVTGYTPDKIWYRVMLDNGEMGFIKKIHLKKGIGNEIPYDSKIIARQKR